MKRAGKDVTVVGIHTMVGKALQAAEQLAAEGIELEVIDPRTLVPLDEQTIIDSVKKTGRLIVSHEAYTRGGYGAEIISRVVEAAFDYLDAPPLRVCARERAGAVHRRPRDGRAAAGGRHRRRGARADEQGALSAWPRRSPCLCSA